MVLQWLMMIDSPGQMFLMDGGIRSKFMNIMGICAQLYLTSNSALLCDLSLLIDRLLVGSNAGHELKQMVTNSNLERIEIWLARRKPHNDDLIAACDMLGQRQEMPGDSAMITDTINNALHPVFSDLLRTVIRFNGVPLYCYIYILATHFCIKTMEWTNGDPAGAEKTRWVPFEGVVK